MLVQLSQWTSKMPTSRTGNFLASVKLLAKYSNIQKDKIRCTQLWNKYSNTFLK